MSRAHLNLVWSHLYPYLNQSYKDPIRNDYLLSFWVDMNLGGALLNSKTEGLYFLIHGSLSA